MSEEHKKRILAILDKVAEKDLKEIDKIQGRTKTRKNSKPEKSVEKECLEWMRNKGWSVHIFEAKATYDPRRGFYRQQSMNAGTADCLGTTNKGISVAVEFKAPKKLKTFNLDKNYKQQEFIKDKINHGAFACVVDTLPRLIDIYETWIVLRERDFESSKKYLHGMLP